MVEMGLAEEDKAAVLSYGLGKHREHSQCAHGWVIFHQYKSPRKRKLILGCWIEINIASLIVYIYSNDKLGS